MRKKKQEASNTQDTVYREESTKRSVAIAGVALTLLIVPLVGSISRINAAGLKSADISKYTTLIRTVDSDMRTVEKALANRLSGLESTERSVTLIIPELVIINEIKPDDERPTSLKIDLKGIYWNPSNPLVGINNETYRVGDKIQGYVIVKIGKTAVHFKAKDGTLVVKDFYENLFKSKK